MVFLSKKWKDPKNQVSNKQVSNKQAETQRDKSANAKAKKKNFSDQEIRVVLKGVQDNYDDIHGKLQNRLTNQKKTKIWEGTCENVNSLGVCRRNVDELRTKWKYLKSKATTDLRHRKHPPTGGGPPTTESSYTDIILDMIGVTSPTLNGVSGGAETGMDLTSKNFL